MRSTRIELKHFAIIAAFAAIAVAPMLFRGIPGGNDAVQHYEFAQHVVDAVRNGDLFPHFAGYANHGFGDVGLRVYPPLSYYALAGGFFVFGEWYAASIAIFFIIFLLGGMGVFVWSLEFVDVNSSLAAAAVYTFAPFHLNEIYNNFLYAEFAASAILPFCFLFVTRVIKNGDVKNVILLSVSYSLLIITHLPLTIIGSIALAIYAVAMVRLTTIASYWKLAASVIAGLLLSSFYWVRMVTEMQWVKHSQPEYFANRWSYNENFLLSARTFTEFMNDGLSLWFGDLILIATVAICIPSIIAWRKFECWKAFGFPLTLLLAAGVFFITPLSYVVWHNAPLLQKVQFPWRWLNIVSLAASAVAGAGLVAIARRLRSENSNAIAIGTAAAVLPFVFVSAFVVRAPHFTSRAEFAIRAQELSHGETFEGWWPAQARRQAFSRKDKLAVNGRSGAVIEWTPTKRSFEIGPGDAGTVEISTFFYPHWKAAVDGIETATSITDDGVISLQIPSQEVRVELNFLEPSIVRALARLSLFAWISAICLLLYSRFRLTRSYGTYS